MGSVFGTETFVDQVLRSEPEAYPRSNLQNILLAVQKVTSVTLDEMQASGQTKRPSEARALAAWAVLSFSDATLIDLGMRFGRDNTSLSSAIKRLKSRAETDSVLAERMEKLKLEVANFATLQS